MKLFWPFLILILTFGLPARGQEEEGQPQGTIRPEDLPQRVHLMPGQDGASDQPAAATGEEMTNAAPLSDDEALLQQIEEDRNRQIEAAVRMGNTTDQVVEGVMSAPDELRKLGHESFDAAAMLDVRVVELMKKMLVDSPLQKMTPLEVRNLILEKVKGQPLEEFLLNHPKVLRCMVDLVRDAKALPSAVGLFLKRRQLKLYAGMWLCLMIMAWLAKKIWFKKDWPPMKTRLLGIAVSLSATVISLTTFYNLFHDEISPSVKIIVKHWRRRNLPDTHTRVIPEVKERKIS